MNWKWWVKPAPPERNERGEMMARAQRAKQALPIMQEAYGDVRQALLDQAVMAGPLDNEARLYFIHAVRGLDALVATVERYATDGDVAEAIEAYEQKVMK